MNAYEALRGFLPPVQEWFRAALGPPTRPQQLGWPVIAAGQHTLILAPTGSGKTLAAFLACLDALWRGTSPECSSPESAPPGRGKRKASPRPRRRGVSVLYISPLKALNNDIHRNLQEPLEGVLATARRMGWPLAPLEAAVRTGDTPTAERQRLTRKPPDILITTPESLHLLLTSRAREVLRHVRFCIVDEIHALCPNKRGVFLSLLLERLEAIQQPDELGRGSGFQRIGLSATQRPLEEVARYLGGATVDGAGGLTPRPVTIVDAGQTRSLDLQVISPVPHFGPLPEKSVWPSIYRLLGDLIRAHRSTIVFANDRRAVERITSFLNEEEDLARAHHGSVSLEARREIEEALKEGRLRAVVATASLELGIDMGEVDLVCQVQSPGSVARGLQRVGRASHSPRPGMAASKGRFLPKSSADLLEQAVLAREMRAARVEPLRVPTGCLDVLAQQLVAMAAMDPWAVPDLYLLVRRAYPYRDLSPQAFEAVLEMISGRYRFAPPPVEEEAGDTPPEGRGARRTPPLTSLHPRVSWDRVHNRLHALPGSQQVALRHGGVIPDTGQYAVYRSAGNVRLGELDEEFVYERRVGDVFLLGTSAWRLDRIEADRVHVSPAEGRPAVLPFWRGEGPGRSADLGQAMGAFLRETAGRIAEQDRQGPLPLDSAARASAPVERWLEEECCLDAGAARSLHYHVGRQLLAAGCLPTDRTILIEASRDPLGDWQVILLSPWGSRVHLGLRLALEALLRHRLGYRPQCLHHDDGLLVRLSDVDEPILDLLAGLTPENVEALLLEELDSSPLFALRFRQNAARALLLPGGAPDRRAPLWLQRLRGKDLLQVVRHHPDFPIVIETYRECLHDHLDLPRLRQLLADVERGAVEVRTRRAEGPCPFAGSLLFSFTAAFLYQGDQVEGGGETGDVDRQLLDQLLAPAGQEHLLDPRAIHQVERRLRGVGQPPRSAAEMGEWLRRLGDLTDAELEGPMEAFLAELAGEGRASRIVLPGGRSPARWILTEEEPLYRAAFGLPPAPAEPGPREASAAILARFLDTHALVSLADILARYPFDADWASRQLQAWVDAGRAIPVQAPAGSDLPSPSWSAAANLARVQSGSLALLRREVVACSFPQFVDFLLRWQGLHPESRRGGPDGLARVLERLEGLPLPAGLWEQWVLPARVPLYHARWLEEWIASGAGIWVCLGDEGENGPGSLAFLGREVVPQLRPPSGQGAPVPAELAPAAGLVLESLRTRGASFVADLASQTGQAPGLVRSALRALVRAGHVTNDRLDVIRRWQDDEPAAPGRHTGRRPLSARLRPRGAPSLGLDGRWSVVPWGNPGGEALVVTQAALLLQRYGVVSRELALMDPWLPPWRVLYEVLSRMELAGEVRRGYFVEGLSGAQFALSEAARLLQDVQLPSTASAPALLLNSLDPACLYGAGAPFEVALLDGGARSFPRRPGSWLVVKAGSPVLLVEQHGRRVTALPSASEQDLRSAVACLPRLLAHRPAGTLARLTVETWNEQPVTTTPGRALLEGAGFVRDYQSLTLYAGVSSGEAPG